MTNAAEDRVTRLKRLGIRSWRRGMKEMDLILGPYSDTELALQDDATLDAYEAMLNENDQELYLWITARTRGEAAGPAHLAPLLDQLAAFALIKLRGN
ncbi:MAG: succinate dehydrogenase assembly factor 2 [Paracoccus denitrificans]|nr:MAG: succinate dehydrogenase assembly factor 2 [Paracoccus denitrificans]PZO84876.1 MAG: succinate dehydrogenase assembly factor 2 [Paracoccus denitrificans]